MNQSPITSQLASNLCSGGNCHAPLAFSWSLSLSLLHGLSFSVCRLLLLPLLRLQLVPQVHKSPLLPLRQHLHGHNTTFVNFSKTLVFCVYKSQSSDFSRRGSHRCRPLRYHHQSMASVGLSSTSRACHCTHTHAQSTTAVSVHHHHPPPLMAVKRRGKDEAQQQQLLPTENRQRQCRKVAVMKCVSTHAVASAGRPQ